MLIYIYFPKHDEPNPPTAELVNSDGSTTPLTLTVITPQPPDPVLWKIIKLTSPNERSRT